MWDKLRRLKQYDKRYVLLGGGGHAYILSWWNIS